jgi:NADPH2:quinone reductase
MLAAYYEGNGPAREVLRVEEVKTPSPGPGELRVRLHASGVNPSDVKSRGLRKLAFPRVIPHSDGAGVIEAVGAGVASARVGERVWIWNGQWQRPFGTAAQYIVVPAAQAARLPDNASFEAGACLGIPAMTAYHAIERAEASADTTLFVSGGAGSVSQFAIQFAKAKGATVITTVSSEDKARAAREAGADHCIDYKRDNVEARVAEITGKRGADAIIEMDLTANAKLIPGVLRQKGSVIIYGTGAEATIPAFACLANSLTLAFFLVYQLDAQQRARAADGINRMLEEGKLSSRIGPTFPLSETAAAHEAVERGTIGNVIVRTA